MEATAIERLPPLMPATHADGIYFGMPDDEYHGDMALGSSGLRDLLQDAPTYWWNSPLNPAREDEDTPSLLRGRAMHKLVLEGGAAFDKLFARSPHHPDMTPAEKSAATKALKAKLPPGMSILPAKDYDRVLIASAMITRNPALKTAFENGIAEVSIFWTDHDGIRCKARFDYLKPRGIGDLKSIANMKRIQFQRACRESISNYRYDVQCAHYMRGRTRLAQFVADGAIHGDHDAALLAAIAKTKVFAFQFVFFAAQDAPVTWSCIISPANPMIELAEQHIVQAVDSWKANAAHFGLNQQWTLEEPPAELMMEEMPPWYAR